VTDLPPQIRQRTVAKALTLLEALPFMREHHGRVIVIKYGGAAMDATGLAASFAEDVALRRPVALKVVRSALGRPSAAQRARQAGLSVVMDRCIMVDHAALLGRSWKAT